MGDVLFLLIMEPFLILRQGKLNYLSRKSLGPLQRNYLQVLFKIRVGVSDLSHIKIRRKAECFKCDKTRLTSLG